MAEYPTDWRDYCLPGGQQFAVAVCSYGGRVRHMTIGNDMVRRMFVRHVEVENDRCSSGDHCLALDCPLNRTKQEHLAHMLDMNVDEPVDAETAKSWGKDTAVGCYVEMARRISAELSSASPAPKDTAPKA